MRALCCSVLQEHKIADSDQVAEDIVRALAREFGGVQIYLPKLSRLELHEKYQRILCDYADGTSVKALARKYSLTTKTIYSIIKLNK